MKKYMVDFFHGQDYYATALATEKESIEYLYKMEHSMLANGDGWVKVIDPKGNEYQLSENGKEMEIVK